MLGVTEATSGAPEFAGVWADEATGGTVVTVAITADGAEAKATPTDVIAALRDATATETLGVPVAALVRSAERVTVSSVDYAFADLNRWHDALTGVFGLDGVVLTDLDERRNAVVVGVDDPTRRETAVRAYATQVGIPADALLVVEATLPSTTLQDNRRPLVGGQQIQYAAPIIGDIGTIFNVYNCTLGVVVDITNASAPAPGILTNSHCSENRGTTDGTYYWQPSIPLGSVFFTDDRFAYEAYDPPLFTGDPWDNATYACPSGANCRLSVVERYRHLSHHQRGHAHRWNGHGHRPHLRPQQGCARGHLLPRRRRGRAQRLPAMSVRRVVLVQAGRLRRPDLRGHQHPLHQRRAVDRTQLGKFDTQRQRGRHLLGLAVH